MNVCSVQNYADMLLKSVLDDGKIAIAQKNTILTTEMLFKYDSKRLLII